MDSASQAARATRARVISRVWRPTLLTTLLWVMLVPLAPAPVAAQAAGVLAPRQYDIPAGQLAEVLTRLGSEARILLMYPAALVNGVRSPGVQGERDGPAALREALRGTGLEAVPTADGYTLRRAPQDSVATLSAVEVTGAAYDPRAEVFYALGSVGVVTRESLDRVPVTSARDIFQGEPGVYVMDGNQDPGINNINIRGIQGPGRINMMIDGTRQNASNYAGYGGQMSRVYIDPELLAGVDIEKGPAGGMYGAGVTGGVVNLRTLNADDLIQGDASHGGRLRVIHGDNGYNTAGMAAGAIRLESGLALTGGISRRKSDNYHTGKRSVPEGGYPYCNSRGQDIDDCSSEVPLTHQDMVSGLFKAQYRFNEAHKLEAGATYYRNEFVSWARGAAADEELGFPEQHVSANTLSLRYQWNPADNPWWDVSANVWRAANRTSYEMFGEHYDMHTVGTEISNTARLPLGEDNLLTLNVGGEFYQDKADTHSSGLTTDPRTGIGREGLTATGKRNIGGWFAQASLAYHEWLQLDAGLRADYFGLRSEGTYASRYVGQGVNTLSLNRSGGRVNPSAALGITPVDGVQFFARYAEGQRAPTLSETAGGGAVWGIYHLPNPYLRPEVARTHEFGLNLILDDWLRSDGKLRLKVARFDSRYDDYILRNAFRYRADYAYSYQFANIDRATLRGVELQAQLDLGYLFAEFSFNQFDRMLFCDAGVCSSDPGRDNINVTTPFIPPKRSIAATLGVRLLERKLVLGARLRADTRRGMTDANQYNEGVYWKPYEIVDLFGSYDATRHLTLGVSVENIADKYYIGAMNFNGLPSPGRSIKGSLTYNF
ncbi:hypothetical protein CBF45_17125 [Bordetella sp. J329]|nr:hypothetical protein CBF45_17125 [Bordetella sp. J329]